MPADDAAATPDLLSLLRGVEEGREYVIARGGRPVARLVAEVPGGRRSLTADQERALAERREAMRRGFAENPGRFDREEVYRERFDQPRQR